MTDPYENLALASSPKPEFLKSSHTHLDFYVFKPVLTFFKNTCANILLSLPTAHQDIPLTKKYYLCTLKVLGFFSHEILYVERALLSSVERCCKALWKKGRNLEKSG